MKILKVYPYPDVKAGTEISMHLGAGALQELGHQVFLLHGMADTPKTAGSYQGSLGLPPLFDRQSKVTPPGFSEALTQAVQFSRRHQIDIIHIHGFPRTAAIRRFAKAAPTVASIHVPLCPNGSRYLWADRRVCDRRVGLGCLTTGYRCKGCGHLGNGLPIALPGFLRAMAENALLRGALKQCSQIVANSAWMQERLVSESFRPETMHVVHAPIVVGEDEGDRAPDDPPVIAFVGRLVDFKGPDHLLRASARIGLPHRLWFIGDGALRPTLEKLAAELDLTNRTTFFGTLPPGEIAEYRRRSAIIVVPSLWPEPFGMVGPEAMLMRRPVVAYRVGGVPEWLQDGVTGRLVAPGDMEGLGQALETLLADPAQRRAMGAAGAEAAEQWKPAHHAAALLKVYGKASLAPRQ